MNGLIELGDERTDLASAADFTFVDHTLSQIRAQEVFTRAEAQLLLREAASGIGNAAAVEVLERAATAFERDLLISRSRMSDALLDARLHLLADASLTAQEGTRLEDLSE